MAIERELSKLWILLTRVNMINTADEQVQRRADLDIDKQLVTQSSKDTCVYLDRQWFRFWGGWFRGDGEGEGDLVTRGGLAFATIQARCYSRLPSERRERIPSDDWTLVPPPRLPQQ